MTLGLGAGLLVGVALGMLGGGGSVLAVPVFVYLLGYGAKEAVAMSLAVVGAASLLGVVGHWRKGNVDVRTALVFGAVAMAGTYLGARLAAFTTDSFQLVLFAGVMGLTAFFMLRQDGGSELPTECREGSPDGRMPIHPSLVVLEGLGVGVLTGLVGVGGGFLIVPVLVLVGGLSMGRAVGTSLLVIAMKSAAGLAGYMGQVEVPWAFVAGFTGVAGVGIVAGTAMTSLIPERGLRRSFAGLLAVMSVFILYENRSLFPGGASPDDALRLESVVVGGR